MTQADNVTPPVKRGRGRPRGSRNKKTVAALEAATEPTAVSQPLQQVAESNPLAGVALASSVAPSSAAPGSLLAKYREMAADLEVALKNVKANPSSMPRDVAATATALRGVYASIGELTGETRLTEQKIVRSEAWRTMATNIGQILSKYPEAGKAVAEYLRALDAA